MTRKKILKFIEEGENLHTEFKQRFSTHIKIAKEFTNTVKEKALGQNVLTTLQPGQLMVKIVKDRRGIHQTNLGGCRFVKLIGEQGWKND